MNEHKFIDEVFSDGRLVAEPKRMTEKEYEELKREIARIKERDREKNAPALKEAKRILEALTVQNG